jgi:hypothetical protein
VTATTLDEFSRFFLQAKAGRPAPRR